jgi:glycosyltransferase involved in cell wall biosynthesis
MAVQLTVLIPCKNEQDHIRACVESARLVADEVLVADSGSTDRTLEIVAALGGCRVIEREFIGYSDFKNWAIPQAQHEWVLIVDADERVTPELAAEIRNKLATVSDRIDGFWIRRRNFFLGHEIKHSGCETSKLFRLLRRDVCRYRACRVHEEIDVRRGRDAVLSQPLLHYTYWTLDQYFEKQVKYTRLSALDRWDAGKRVTTVGMLVTPFLRFFQLYVLRLGFLDGLAGLQICMLQAFFVTFVKQARLWEISHALPQPREQFPVAPNQSRRAA